MTRENDNVQNANGVRDLIERRRESIRPTNHFTVSSTIIRDIHSLQEALQELESPELWLYRGQIDSQWTLRPQFNRDLSADQEVYSFEAIEDGAAQFLQLFGDQDDREEFEDWKAEARGLIDNSALRPRSSIEWLAVGRHHGLRTRLLDWTHNPLVGAYFAVRKEECSQSRVQEMEGALFALRGIRRLEARYESDPWLVRGIRLWHPPSLVERIGRQSSAFTLHQVGLSGGSLDLVRYAKELWYEDLTIDTERLLSSSPPFPQVVKFRIDPSRKSTLRDELRLFGVDEYFAFRDLGGLSRAYEEGRMRRPRPNSPWDQI